MGNNHDLKPFTGMQEGGLTELVGINEQVDTSDYSGSVAITIGTGTDSLRPASGEILSATFYATEDGTGAVLPSAGQLLILDADPEIASGDTAMTAAERVTVLGRIKVLETDYQSDANGASATILTQPVPFHDLAIIYVVWFHESATSINSSAADDEQLEVNLWFRQDS